MFFGRKRKRDAEASTISIKPIKVLITTTDGNPNDIVSENIKKLGHGSILYRKG